MCHVAVSVDDLCGRQSGGGGGGVFAIHLVCTDDQVTVIAPVHDSWSWSWSAGVAND